ncbi:TonB-dependent receptor [Sphingomonas sp. GB1N7]|uniref:TonB-dependent receptor n=1 Tax=Parasphingomonas caseinilytica TaxID=3096158 RepID=UPI002FC970A8
MLLPLADVALVATSVKAREAGYAIDIPAGSIGSSLNALSTATGISIGYDGDLPPIRTRAVRGRMDLGEVLSRMLAGTGLIAVRIGPSAFRLQRVPKHAQPRIAMVPPRSMASASAPPIPVAEADIIVTGQKRPQALREVPMSVSVVALADVTDRVSPGSRDLALSVDGLALTNLGPGRNRQFIRGVADSPFIGPSQSTVAVQIDNARITFDAPDPDLRLIDVYRVEILKGPQGPLYGSGALGGIYHIVTRKPVLDETSASARLLGETVAHGSAGFGGEAVLNLPIVTDKLAVRAAGYVSRSGGWIDDIGRKANANVATIYGGRLALRWQPTEAWSVNLGGIVQNINVADSQYVTVSDDTLRRVSPVAEPVDNDFRAVTATIEGDAGPLKLVSATSYVDHRVDFTLDASTSAAALGVLTPAVFRDNRAYTIFNQELRFSPVDSGIWLAGISFLRATSRSDARLSDANGTAPVESLNRIVAEYALFGEMKLPLGRRIDATAGLRLFRTMAENEAVERSDGASRSVGKTVLSPSIALSWAPDTQTIVFLRYARAVRPGGLSSSEQNVATRFQDDALGTIDLGIRHQPPGARFSYSASVFYTQWDHIQSDYLLANGLVSTRNAGCARIIGAEASVDWAVLPATRISAGVALQDGRLTRNEAGIAIDDRRLPVTPDLTARLSIAQDFELGSWHSTINAQGNYIGRARLTFDPDIDQAMGRYATVSTAVSVARRRLTLGARIDNLFDVRGDSFAFGNPFSIRTTDQYVPLRPRTITLSIGRAF